MAEEPEMPNLPLSADDGGASPESTGKGGRGRHSKPSEGSSHRGSGSILHEAFEFLMMIAIALVLVFGIQRFLIQPYRIPSGSMEPTIEIGELVLSEKVSYYSRTPAAGEIVTFMSPMNNSETLIKRVIATGGQTVDLKDGSVYVDGVKLDESYTHGKESWPFDTTMQGVSISYPFTIPDGYIWVMGDNRTNSEDSRYFGAVPVSTVSGHACCAYWPLDRFGALG